MTKIHALLIVILLAFFVSATIASADPDQEYNRILRLKIANLTEESFTVLDQRYPDEDWDAYQFPQYVYTNESVEAGYMIAVKEPDLLKNFKCYCFCDAMGHESLLNCFIKGGDAEGEFDDHAASCNICYGQAMMAFLWQEAGVPIENMQQGYEKKFERLIKGRTDQ
jgi:hypothetical protein